MVLMGVFFFFLKCFFFPHPFYQHIACMILYRICFLFIVLHLVAYWPGCFPARVLSHKGHLLESGLEEDGGVCTVIGCEAAEWQLIRHHVSDTCDMCDMCDMCDILLGSATQELVGNSRPHPASRPSSFWSRFHTTPHSKQSATLSPVCTLVYTIWHNN